MKKLTWAFAICLGIGLAQNQPQNPPPGLGLHDNAFVVKLLSPLSTKTAVEGDVFTASVEEPKQFLGAVMEGRITKLKKPEKGVGKGKAEIQFQFETITFNGQTVAVKAELKDVKNSQGQSKVDEEGHVIGVSSNKKRLLSAVLGAGTGALLGAAAGGGRGAAIGAAAGAAAGLVVGLKMTTAASDIEFKPGSLFTLSVSDAGNKRK